MDAGKFRVVLVDEPPAEEIWADGNGGEGGPASPAVDIRSSSGGEAAAVTKTAAEILGEHLKECCILVVAHHLASLKGCDRVWVMADGRKVAECATSEIDTEQKFNALIASASKGAS